MCRRENYKVRTLLSAAVRTELCTSPAVGKLIFVDGFPIGGLCARGVVRMVARTHDQRAQTCTAGCTEYCISEQLIIVADCWELLVRAYIAL
jgi:hypothetical protein